MASEALIALVVDQLKEKLTLYAEETVTLVRSARGEVAKLAGTLQLIQKVVADAEQKQVTNDAVRVWLAKLKDVAYDAEDVLDEWNTKTALSRLQTGDVDVNIASGSISKKVFSFIKSFKDGRVRYIIGRQIKEIRERLDEIAKEREQYALVASDSHNESLSITPPTTSFVNVSEIYGRDSDKRKIMNMILSDSSSQGQMPVHVISIVGTGGFGKTTLAKLILKEKEVENAFDFRIWVCVSQPFNLSRIAKEIVEQATNKPVPEFHGLEPLHRRLSDSVKGKRFLLTLDDVWTNDQREWEPLKLSLSEGASGSRIIVTTRSREVALMTRSTHIHELRELSEEDSWSLLSHVALGGREQHLQKFEKIGRKIASKCKGVPLAIQTLASLLYDKRSIQEWRDVANNNLWEMPQIKEFFLPSLLISYYSLSPVSKRCFSFCSLFPKDTRIRRSELVELWIANGFFGYEGNKELEKMGEDHFNSLAMRSFFQDFERDSDEVIYACKMHDLVHDFAQFLSQGECFPGDGSEFDASKLRHLWIERYNKFYEAKNLRTLFAGEENDEKEVLLSHIDKLAGLRVLNVESYMFTELPISVCGLLHLRCLSLSNCDNLSELPEEICNLYNLQTLDLRGCFNLRKLPERIGDLCNLRHLKIKGTDELKCLPQGIKRLTFLRTLDKVIVSETNREFKIGDLSHLHRLQGHLKIHGLGRLKDANEIAQPELNKKNAIGRLKLYFDALGAEETSELDMVQINTAYSVLERLEPPEHLEKLLISGYLGDRFPGWMHRLSNVVQMELSHCVNCTQLPPLGNLESLEKLVIDNLRSMKRLNPVFFGVGDGVVSFPRLRKLVFSKMSELEEWNIPPFLKKDASMSRIMPNLIQVQIESCEKLKVLPHYMISPTLEKLKIWNCKLFEKLNFGGDEGVSSEPLPLNNQSVQVAHPSPRTMPNLRILESLRSLVLFDLPNWKGEERGECPSFIEVEINQCNKLKVLPHYMISPTLEKLEICLCELLEKLNFGGDEGVSSEPLPLNNQSVQVAHSSSRTMPNLRILESLRSLLLTDLPNWKGEERGECPSLIEVKIMRCNKLKVLPHYMISPTLEKLEIWNCKLFEKLNFGGDEGVSSEPLPLNNQSVQVAHPSPRTMPNLRILESLRSLVLYGLPNWKGEERGECPSLIEVEINQCNKLKVLPHYMISPTLEKLNICWCELLEKLNFGGDEGVSSEPLPLNNQSVQVTHPPHLSLKFMYLLFCGSLDLDLKDLQQFTNLQYLNIYNCYHLKNRFQGEEWRSILSHVAMISLDGVTIKEIN